MERDLSADDSEKKVNQANSERNHIIGSVKQQQFQEATTSKKDLKKLLKIALDVDLEDDEQIGDVETVYSDGDKVYAAL